MTHSGDCCRWYSRNSSWAVDRVASNSFISWSFSFSCCLKTVAWFCKLAVSYFFSCSFPWKVIICWVTPLSCSFLSCIFPRRFVSCCSVSANCFLKVSSSSFFFPQLFIYAGISQLFLSYFCLQMCHLLLQFSHQPVIISLLLLFLRQSPVCS